MLPVGCQLGLAVRLTGPGGSLPACLILEAGICTLGRKIGLSYTGESELRS